MMIYKRNSFVSDLPPIILRKMDVYQQCKYEFTYTHARVYILTHKTYVYSRFFTVHAIVIYSSIRTYIPMIFF